MRRLLLVGAGVLTALLLAYGCYVLVDALAIEDRSSDETFAAVPTVRLDVEGGGRVRIVGDGGDQVRVELEWREGLRRPTVEARVDDGELVVRTECPALFGTFCTVRATIHVPTGTAIVGTGSSPVEVVDVGGPVDVAVDDGSVRVDGAEGGVRVRTDNGSIVVADGRGPLDLQSDNGSVRTERVEADVVSAATDNGRVELDLAGVPDTVRAGSDNGSVTVLLPLGSGPFAVVTSAGDGNVENLLDTSPTAERTIDATTDNGTISLRYRS